MPSTTAAAPRLRRLPSADWLAFGVGVLAMALQYLFAPLLSVVALAVFAPSLLRELGWLHDADEFTVRVMHRAGFHAALLVAGLVFLNHLVPAAGWYPAPRGDGGAIPFPDESLRKGVVWVFLLSYLIQYWGARQGATRILLGAAVMVLVSVVAFLRQPGERTPLWIATTVGSAVVMVLLAGTAQRWPRSAGGILLAITALVVISGVRYLVDPRYGWSVASVLLQAILLGGVTGVALVRSAPREER